ncbi:SHOCT domain-containing protein [Clostridium algoriphilum]|uniref:SHOCT domain-containing protein n=1 Tax=Clostridium algoriphilum TaxID=198347 RepID=UPI001CF5F824|nr:SHOCT domain-containing protein [Clostridium algoriphilum]MCB2295948.1 SHOCT domain-containing protein [Clostridium algoriphilum]
MRKKKSFINPITVCTITGAILLFNVFYKMYKQPVGAPTSEFTGRLYMGGVGAMFGSIIGLMLGLFIYTIFKPSKTKILLLEQRRMIKDFDNNNNNNNYNNNNNNDKIDKLSKLNELKKSGAISDEEFNKLKKEIINRKQRS